jgi:predicted nuclease of predicted toxin-antitoxin system
LSSQKPSIISPELRLLEVQNPLFLDFNLGNKVVPSALDKAGISHNYHTQHFPGDKPDHEWIPIAAKNNWLIITKDKNIEFDPVNRQAVIESGARVFIMDHGSIRAIYWAAALIVSRKRIYEIVRVYDGPFFSTISHETRGLVSLPKKS